MMEICSNIHIKVIGNKLSCILWCHRSELCNLKWPKVLPLVQSCILLLLSPLVSIKISLCSNLKLFDRFRSFSKFRIKIFLLVMALTEVGFLLKLLLIISSSVFSCSLFVYPVIFIFLGGNLSFYLDCCLLVLEWVTLYVKYWLATADQLLITTSVMGCLISPWFVGS